MIRCRMLTPEELKALDALLSRARAAASAGIAAAAEPITAGDVVQLRPGASQTWETSIMLVEQAEPYKLRGPILRMHRSGCREAWHACTPAQVHRIGRAAFPRPADQICSGTYNPGCGNTANYRASHAADQAGIDQQLRDAAALIDAERKGATKQRKQAMRAHGRKTKEQAS